MAIYIENKDMLDQMFNACSTEQIAEFASQKRSFRIHGHSTTIRLERAFWNVLEFIAENRSVSLPILIEVIHDQCIVANDKNLASCLRVICSPYKVIIWSDARIAIASLSHAGSSCVAVDMSKCVMEFFFPRCSSVAKTVS